MQSLITRVVVIGPVNACDIVAGTGSPLYLAWNLVRLLKIANVLKGTFACVLRRALALTVVFRPIPSFPYRSDFDSVAPTWAVSL